MSAHPCVVCGAPGRSSRKNTTCGSEKCVRTRKRQYDRERYPEIAPEVRKRASDWNKSNKSRKAEYDRAYREKNADKVLEARRAWTQKRTATRPEYSILAVSRRRARMQRNGIFRVTEKDLRRILSRYRGMCAYCGVRPFEHWDHVLPISRGGAHSVGNLLPSCQVCNQSKNSSTVVEWRRRAPQGVR